MNIKLLILVISTSLVLGCGSDESYVRFRVEAENDGIIENGSIRFTFRDGNGLEIKQSDIDFVPFRWYRVRIPDGSVYFEYFTSQQARVVYGKNNSPVWFSGSYMLISIEDNRRDFTFYAHDPVEILQPQQDAVFFSPERLILQWKEVIRAERYLIEVRLLGSAHGDKWVNALLPNSNKSIDLFDLIKILNSEDRESSLATAIERNVPFVEGDFPMMQNGRLEMSIQGMLLGPDDRLWQLTATQGGRGVVVEVEGL